jgi:hypothetical protein
VCACTARLCLLLKNPCDDALRSEELRDEYERLKKEKTEAEEKHLFVQQKKKVWLPYPW